MKAKPIFSIIVPTLNEEKYLPKLLNDLVNQSQPPSYEVIIVDGNSADRTQSEAKEFAGKLDIKIIVSKVRHVSNQRNLGADKARGDWLIFFDADTSIRSNFLNSLEMELKKLDCDCFTCLVIPETDDLADVSLTKVFNIGTIAASHINKPQAWGPCMGAKRDVFIANHGFNQEVDFQEDGELVNRLTKLGYKFSVLNQPRFIMSMRRFRAMGRMQVIRNAAILQLKNNLLGFDTTKDQKLYPMMGGSFYDINSLTKSPIKKIISTMDRSQLIAFSKFRLKAFSKASFALKNRTYSVDNLKDKISSTIRKLEL